MTKSVKSLEREWGLAQYEVLKNLIEEGKWDFSKDTLKIHYRCYRYRMWSLTYAIFMVVISLFMRFITGDVFTSMLMGMGGIVMFIVFQTESMRYKEHLRKLKIGKLIMPDSVPKNESNGPEKIAKLHDLLKEGALTEQEYLEAKDKILKSVA